MTGQNDEKTDDDDGIFTPNGIHGTDETDLAASRLNRRSYVHLESERVHIIWDLFAIASILTFIADITTDLVVSVHYFLDGKYIWFALTLGFVILSSLVMQIFSAKWFHEDGEYQNWCTYLMHLFQLGPIVRYWRVVKTGWRTRQQNSANTVNVYEVYLAEWRDITLLRLFECFLESAPQLVLQLFIMAHNKRFDAESDWLTVFATGSSLVSLAWAIAAYHKALRDLLRQRESHSWVGFFLQIIWRMCMVASRVVALVLFASYYTIWLFVVVAIHWLVMTTWLIFQKTRFCVDDKGIHHRCREYLFDAVIGFVYIFCFFNIREGMTRIRIIPYYVIMLLENTVFVVMWYPFRTLYGDIEIAALSIVWGAFGIGLLCMISYYSFYHPSLPVKGICVKKSGLNLQEHQRMTICGCCFCEITARQSTMEENNDKSRLAIHLRPFESARNKKATHSYGSLPVDVEILPRMSREIHSPIYLNRQEPSNGEITGIRGMYARSSWL